MFCLFSNEYFIEKIISPTLEKTFGTQYAIERQTYNGIYNF